MKAEQLKNEKLTKLNNDLINKIKKISSSQPRKDFRDLGQRQVRRRSVETQKFASSRSPDFLRENTGRKKLNTIEDITINLEIGMTGKQREKMKNHLNKLSLDIFSPTNQFKNLKQGESSFSKFDRFQEGMRCTNVYDVLCRRVQRLFESGKFYFSIKKCLF